MSREVPESQEEYEYYNQIMPDDNPYIEEQSKEEYKKTFKKSELEEWQELLLKYIPKRGYFICGLECTVMRNNYPCEFMCITQDMDLDFIKVKRNQGCIKSSLAVLNHLKGGDLKDVEIKQI